MIRVTVTAAFESVRLELLPSWLLYPGLELVVGLFGSPNAVCPGCPYSRSRPLEKRVAVDIPPK